MSDIPKEAEQVMTDDEKKQLKRIKSLTDSAYKYSSKMFDDRAKYKRRYLNDMDVEKADWQGQIAHPLPHLAVERKSSFLTDAVMGNASRPLFKVRPWADNINAVRKSRANTAYIQQQQAQMSLTELFYTAFKTMFTSGTAILHTFWDNQIEVIQPDEEQVVEVARNEDGSPIFENGKRKLIVTKKKPQPIVIPRTDRPGIVEIDINNFWPDPAATSLEDARFIVVRKVLPFKTLKHFEKLGRLKNVDLLKKTQFTTRETRNYHADRLGRYSNFSQFRESRLQEYGDIDPDNKMVEIIEFYEPGKVSIMGNDSILLDVERPVYRARYPFVRLANLPQTGEFFGLSEFVICDRLFTHVDQMQNMIFDNWEKHLKGVTLIDSGVSEMALEQLKAGEPGDVIRINDLNGIKTERPELFDASVVQGMEILLQECKDAMSVDGAISGVSPGSEVRDSQSFEIFTRISQVTLSVMVRRIQESLRDLGRQWVALNKQFLKDPIRIRLAGANAMDTLTEGKNVDEEILDPKNPADIPYQADVDVQLSTIADVRRDREIRQMVEGINLAAQNSRFRGEDALLQLFAKLDVFEDTLSLFVDPSTPEGQQELLNRSQINAMSAGKQNPVLAGRFAPQNQPQGQPVLSPQASDQAPAGAPA